MKITVDYTKEWAQIFDEAWRAYPGWFLSGEYAWRGLEGDQAEICRPAALRAKTRLDLNYIIGEMIGELGVRARICEPG